MYLFSNHPYLLNRIPKYYYFDNNINDRFEIQKNLVSLNTLARAYSQYNNPELSKKYRELFENNYSRNSIN